MCQILMRLLRRYSQLISNKGYFDTNILVSISLIKAVDHFYQTFPVIKICNQVKEEIEGWNIANFSYNHIYFDTKGKINDGNIKVISLHDFNLTEKQLINYQVNAIKNEMGNLGTNEDLGEVHSVFMALTQGSPYFCTDDNKFVKRYRKRHFKDLHIVTFDDVLNELYEDSETHKSKRELARSENNKMTLEFEKIKSNGNRNDTSTMDDNAINTLLEYKKLLT